MNGCDDCNKTIRTDNGEMSIDMCKMLGTCTCNHKNNSSETC